MTIRVRIAPSPTGRPHVGTAYVALFNFCFAKSQNGSFIVRIEDTDKKRSTNQAELDIFEALHWLGLDWDEGPDKGGDFGPYRQSERTDIYADYGNKLLIKGDAFRCFCSPEKLTAMRAQQNNLHTGYAGTCLNLSATEVQKRLDSNETFVIRLKVPTHGTCTIRDLLRDQIHIAWQQVDMQVLIKADGCPTYHMACVVDDHLMQISHVIRGEEWINSTPKHLLLYKYFGWEPPVFCHLPLLRNPDKSKLSKRKNPTSILYYKDKGYLPEALLNNLGRMGWSMPDEREVFTLADMTAAFRLEDIRLGEPIFNLDKLNWINGQWLRSMNIEDYTKRLSEWLFNPIKLEIIMPVIQERIETYADLAPKIAYLFGNTPPSSTAAFANLNLSTEEVRQVLQFSIWHLEDNTKWSPEYLQTILTRLAKAMGFKIRDFLTPLFISLSGNSVALPLYVSMILLGKDLVKQRLLSSLNILGGVSKKQAKKYEKEYQKIKSLDI